MDFFILASFIGMVLFTFKLKDERKRIALLGSHLGKFQIEKIMETLTGGYLRALAESGAERQGQIWRQMESSEQKLSEQFSRFAAEFARVPEADARVSKLPIQLPYASMMFPQQTFDMRKALAIHAQGIARAAEAQPDKSDKSRAFTLSAELFLMQHSCHWFCKSRGIASARMVVRHKTSYEQLVQAVSPETRRAYNALVGN
jgi:hypothetical protein